MIINIILINDNIILINNKVEQNKPKRQKNITNDTSTTSSIIQKQPLISGYLRRPMSQKDIPYLENLILRMCVSNGLPFSFIENEDTKAFFNFLAKISAKIYCKEQAKSFTFILSFFVSTNLLTSLFKPLKLKSKLLSFLGKGSR